MVKIVFWDVDTQIDFIEPTGKLYVSGADETWANLAYLTELGAREINEEALLLAKYIRNERNEWIPRITQ